MERNDLPALRPPEGVEAVLLALSGGPDSMLLLHLLLPLHRAGRIRLSAAHLMHGLRPEAPEEAAFVRAYCGDAGIPCTVEEGDVRGEAARSGRGLEDAGRELRHRFLRRRMAAERADCIALGQHMDDQAETVLMHLGRGSGLAGLCGMREYRPPLWRPLLGLRKGEILALAAAENIPYVLDKSNDSPEYTRNRLRLLFPQLEGVQPRFVENAARSASLLQEDEDLLENLAGEALEERRRGDGLDVSRWGALHPALARRVLRRYARQRGLHRDLEQRHTAALEDLCRGRSGRRIDLPWGYAARRDFDLLRIAPCREEDEPPFCLPLALGENATPWGVLTVEEIPRPPELGTGWPTVFECDPAALEGAVLRSPRPGDRMQPLGMKGRKKVSDIWTDGKIPVPERKLVLAAPDDENGEGELLWVPGLRLSARCDGKNADVLWRLTWRPIPPGANFLARKFDKEPL